VGDRDGADRILREAERDIGEKRGSLKISPQSIRGQQEAARLTPLERRRKSAGKLFKNFGEEDTLP
jgi:hypothetical protein